MKNINKLTKAEPIFNKVPPAILTLATIILLVELFAQLLGSQYRSIFLMYLGFFPLTISIPGGEIFYGQKYTMFFTYSILHGNFLHMILNLGIIVAVGKKIEEQIGYIRLLILFFSASIVAAIFFLNFSLSQHLPMIGASGSAFGFLGYWKTEEFIFRAKNGLPLRPVFIFLLALIIGHFFIVFIFPFGIAWEAHFGGLVTGIFLTLFLDAFRF